MTPVNRVTFAPTPKSVKRVAIIGSGVVGVTTAKCCLEQGIEVVVFERSPWTGGLWRFHSGLNEDGAATVMHSTVINSSKEASAFSDFPPDPDWPNFVHNSLMIEYIDRYGATFNFNSYVRLRHEVREVKPTGCHPITGKWLVTVCNLENSVEQTEIFDAVYVCTGHHGYISQPKFEGQDQFEGEIIHSHHVKSGERFRGQRVVVVGLGNSGADLCAELAPIAKQVYASIRNGTWIANRVGPWGLPFDYYFLRRIFAIGLRFLPYGLFCSLVEPLFNFRFCHKRYALTPKHRLFSQHITVNDALPNLIISGRVQIRAEIKKFTSKSVILIDDTEVECDTVICATGYRTNFPFLSPEIVRVEHNRISLYKYLFAPHLNHSHTLAFLGLVQPLGPVMPVAEMQARWCAQLLTEQCRPLPSQTRMRKDIEAKIRINQKRFYKSDRHALNFDWLPYLDELAQEIGVMPPFCKYFFIDPRLWWKLVFGMPGNYQWRLVGPHAWSKARQTIMSVNDRIEKPFQTRSSQTKHSHKSSLKSRSPFRIFNKYTLLVLLLILVLVLLNLFYLYENEYFENFDFTTFTFSKNNTDSVSTAVNMTNPIANNSVLLQIISN